MMLVIKDRYARLMCAASTPRVESQASSVNATASAVTGNRSSTDMVALPNAVLKSTRDPLAINLATRSSAAARKSVLISQPLWNAGSGMNRRRNSPSRDSNVGATQMYSAGSASPAGDAGENTNAYMLDSSVLAKLGGLFGKNLAPNARQL